MAERGKPDHPGVLNFFRANFALATLIIAVLAVGPDVRAFVAAQVGYSIAALVAVEALVILVLWLLYRVPGAADDEDPFPQEALKRDRLDFRFGMPADFCGTEQVFHEWFGPQLSIDDDEYIAILGKGPFVRIAEVSLSHGAHESKQIVGYYAVLPMARVTYERLAAGKLKESDLKADMVLDFDDPNAVVLYIPEICASKKWDIGGSLLRDLLRYAIKALQDHPHIEIVSAWPYTKYGRRLVRDYMMKPRHGKLFGKLHEISRALALALPRPKTPFEERWSITY